MAHNEYFGGIVDKPDYSSTPEPRYTYLTEPIPDKDLEEDRLRAINQPNFVERAKQAEVETDLRHRPDGLYVTWGTVETDDGEEEEVYLTDEDGCILTLGQLKDLLDMLMPFYLGVADEELDQINLNRRERGFIEWVELNAGVPYEQHIAEIEGRIPYQRRGYPRAKQPGYVYVLQGHGLYKIGRSKNPQQRMGTFGMQLPFDVELLYLITTDDYTGLESKLHKRFAAKRKKGEWFDLDAADLSYLKEMAE